MYSHWHVIVNLLAKCRYNIFKLYVSHGSTARHVIAKSLTPRFFKHSVVSRGSFIMQAGKNCKK